MRKMTKEPIVLIFFLKLKTKTCWKRKGGQWLRFWHFRERRTFFSLDFRAIRPSKFFGAKRKDVLCDEAYTWAPILRSFDKLREVGDLSYLGFTLYLSVLQYFGCIEAVRGRLIGPKTWDRVVGIFKTHMDCP